MIMVNSIFVSAGLFFVLIFLSGFWLNRTGKPYRMMIITIHKLLGLATGIYLSMTIYRIHHEASIGGVEITAVVLTILFFISLVVTGGLLSAERHLPVIAQRVHKLFPYLTVLSSGVMIYLFS